MMISYATIEKITENTVRLHLDMYPEMCRSHVKRKWRKPYILHEELQDIQRFIPDISEGDVVAVEHSDDCIITYIEKDEAEKQRRTNHLRNLYELFTR